MLKNQPNEESKEKEETKNENTRLGTNYLYYQEKVEKLLILVL